MSNVYAAYGPVPTSIGVTASPRLNGSLDRRAIVAGRSATLGRQYAGSLGRGPSLGMGSSYQDIRRSRECLGRSRECLGRSRECLGQSRECISRSREFLGQSRECVRRSRECLELQPTTMDPRQQLDTLEVGGMGSSVLRSSMDGFPAFPTTTLERRRNGGLVTGGCSVHGGTLSRPVSRAGSRYHLGPALPPEPQSSGCCRRSCCTLTFSVLACLLILGGVIVALYFFIKNVPHEDRAPIQEESCEQLYCAWGADCVKDEAGTAFCNCTTECTPSSTTAVVCGSDGITYPTICQLRRHACHIQQEIRINYSGPCDEPPQEEPTVEEKRGRSRSRNRSGGGGGRERSRDDTNN